MNKTDQIEQAKFLIGRYDSYFSVANIKGYYLMAYQFFILGTVVLNSNMLEALFSEADLSLCLYRWCVILIVGTSLLSITFVLISIFPFLQGSSFPRKKYHIKGKKKYVDTDEGYSMIFFKSISSFKVEAFKSQFVKQTSAEMVEDYMNQVHSLSKGLSRKFKFLRYAGAMIYIHVALSFLLLITYCYETF